MYFWDMQIWHFCDCSSIPDYTPPNLSPPPQVSLFLFHSLSARGETSPVSAARNITADCSICLVQQIPFSPARVAGFHFHRGENLLYTNTPMNIFYLFIFFTSRYKPNSAFPTLNQKVLLHKKYSQISVYAADVWLLLPPSCFSSCLFELRSYTIRLFSYSLDLCARWKSDLKRWGPVSVFAKIA